METPALRARPSRSGAGRLGLLLAGAIAGCGEAPPPAVAPRVVTIPPAPPAPDAPALTAKPAVVERERTLDVTVSPIALELDPDSVERARPTPMACDYQRFYRGTFGATKVSVLLERAPGSPDVRGLVHYDKAGPAIEAPGKVSGETAIRLAEKGGGTLAATCNPATGILRGEYTLRGKRQPLELFPRPAGWPALHELTQDVSFPPNHPNCNQVPDRDKPREIELAPDGPRAICPPSNPAKRRAFLKENPFASCRGHSTSLQLFGLPREVMSRVNTSLDNRPILVEPCLGGTSEELETWVAFAGDGVLTVQDSSARDEGGAHPMIFTGSGHTIDLRTGSRVLVDDLIVDRPRLRELTASCLPAYLLTRDAEKAGRFTLPPSPPEPACEGPDANFYLWSCGPDDSFKEPMLAVVEGGIAVLGHAHPHALHYRDGRGPIVSYAVLLREKLLKAGSPIARLWQGTAPAAPGAPACTSGFNGNLLVRWSEVPEPPDTAPP